MSQVLSLIQDIYFQTILSSHMGPPNSLRRLITSLRPWRALKRLRSEADEQTAIELQESESHKSQAFLELTNSGGSSAEFQHPYFHGKFRL